MIIKTALIVILSGAVFVINPVARAEDKPEQRLLKTKTERSDAGRVRYGRDQGRTERAGGDQSEAPRAAGADQGDQGDLRSAVESRIIARAWQRFQAKRYDQAERLFRRVVDNARSTHRDEARLGLGYTLAKTGRAEAATTIFQELIESGYQLDKTIPALMGLLLEEGRLDQARRAAAGLPEGPRSHWVAEVDRLINQARLRPLEKALTKAWQAFENGDYKQAEAFFRNASSRKSAPFRNDARLGLAYALVKLGDKAEAQDVFQDLIDRNFKLNQTVPGLLHILLETKQLDLARAYLTKLDPADRGDWDRRLTELEFDLALDRLTEPDQADALVKLIDSYGPYLKNCRFQDQFRRAAGRLGKWGRADGATKLYLSLLSCRPGHEWDKRVDLFTDMAAWLPAKTALGEIRKERNSLPANRADYGRALSVVEAELLKKRLTEVKAGSDEFNRLAGQAVALAPEDVGLRAFLAWACFNKKDFACAENHFRFLNQQDPTDKNYAEGLAYTLIELGRDEEALEVIDRYEKASGLRESRLKRDVLVRLGGKAFKAEEHRLAAERLGRADRMLRLDTQSTDLLAWSLYHSRDYEAAATAFERLFQADPNPDRAENALLAQSKAKAWSQREAFLERLAASGAADLKAVAGRSFFFDGRGITAAQADASPDAVYRNHDSPRLDGGAYFRSRSGDDGLSQLDQFVFPARLSLPFKRGGELSFTWETRRLDAGPIPDAPYAGAYYRYLNDPAARTGRLTRSQWVHSPGVELLLEGAIEYKLSAATTPINGPIDPMVVFEAAAGKRNDWLFRAHQYAVEETMLSFIGRRNPYGGRTWGRVVRSGALARKSFSLGGPWWSSVELGYDYYWGVNTTQNHSVGATLGVGRTDNFSSGLFTSGVLAVTKFFKKNTNFQTFGHGGYFSPQAFALAGPFLRYHSKPGLTHWLDVQASGGYLYHRTDSAPHYPLAGSDAADLNQGARNDLNGRYPGEEKSGFGFDLKLRAFKLIGDRLTVGAYGGLNNTSDFTQAYGGLLISLSFQPLNSVYPPDRLLAQVETIHR